MMKKYIVKQCFLPPDSSRRAGEMTPKWITIHEVSLGTGRSPAEYDTKRYSNMLNTGDSKVGYHFLIEANQCEVPVVYQFLESTVATAHTGSLQGNAESIGIERLINVNTSYSKAIELQAKLAATLMYKYNIPISNVVPHQKWSGKKCPSRLLSNMYGGWDGFIKQVQYFFDKREFLDGIQ